MVQIVRECSTLFSIVKNYFTYPQFRLLRSAPLLERHATAVRSKIVGIRVFQRNQGRTVDAHLD